MSDEFLPALPVMELKLGGTRVVEIDGNDVLLANVDGKIYAVRNICTHGGAPLSMGQLKGCAVQCSIHRAVFDLRSGVSGFPAKRRLITYGVKIDGSWIMVERVARERIFPFEKMREANTKAEV